MSRDKIENGVSRPVANLLNGAQHQKVARKHGVSDAAANRWADKFRPGSDVSLRSTKARRISRLNEGQLEEVLEILVDETRTIGFDTHILATQRVHLVIPREFGVTYNADYVGGTLHEKRYTNYQKPTRVASERDEAARATWLRTTRPQLKRSLA